MRCNNYLAGLFVYFILKHCIHKVAFLNYVISYWVNLLHMAVPTEQDVITENTIYVDFFCDSKTDIYIASTMKVTFSFMLVSLLVSRITLNAFN